MFTNRSNSRVFFVSLNITMALALLIGSAVSPTPARAASTITVTTSADNTTTDTFCSLREAITNANDDAMTFADCAVAGSGNDTIVFANGITSIVLGSTLPTISDFDGLTINGGSDVTINGSDTYRILIVDGGISLTLENLTLKDGACTSCAGGGIYSSGGTVTLNNSAITSSQQGIFVYNGTVTITNSTFSGNSSTYGGAVNASGSSSMLTISNSVFSSNDSPGGGGSAVYSGGTMTITNSSFTNNIGTGGSGSSIFNDGANATIKNSTFSGIVSATTRAIYNNGATLTVSNSTFTGNEVSDNGGGIANANGTLTVKNSTFSGNKAPSGGADIYQYGASASLNLYNSILANDNGGGDCVLGGGTISANNNLIEDSSNACGLTNGANGNIVGSDPNLGTLTGSPAYFPLNAGSLALNAGDDTICAADPVNNTSQNGITRPQGSHCDIGSTEKIFILTSTFRSAAAQDGWVLESTEFSNAGGSLNNTGTLFNLGDDAADKQYRAILSFNTFPLPDTAVITKVTLKIKKQGLVGTDPFTTHGILYIDIRTGAFSANAALQAGDFQATASKPAAGAIPNTPVYGWYSKILNSTAFPFINKTGWTQFRLRFQMDDNNDNGADNLRFFSGDYSTVSYRPTLIIEYYVP